MSYFGVRILKSSSILTSLRMSLAFEQHHFMHRCSYVNLTISSVNKLKTIWRFSPFLPFFHFPFFFAFLFILFFKYSHREIPIRLMSR